MKLAIMIAPLVCIEGVVYAVIEHENGGVSYVLWLAFV